MSDQPVFPVPEPDQEPIINEIQPASVDVDEENRKIPPAVIKRLALYCRALQDMERDKVEKISSTDLANALDINSSQVRKDLAHFGQFGVPGFGYPVKELRHNLKSILGTDKEVGVVLVGAGHLGTALLSYGGFLQQGFRITCAFDINVAEKEIGPDKIPVYHISELEKQVKAINASFAIMTVPQEVAQETTDHLIEAGISAILNFVPMRLKVPDHVKIHYVDLALEMESLSYYNQYFNS